MKYKLNVSETAPLVRVGTSTSPNTGQEIEVEPGQTVQYLSATLQPVGEAIIPEFSEDDILEAEMAEIEAKEAAQRAENEAAEREAMDLSLKADVEVSEDATVEEAEEEVQAELDELAEGTVYEECGEDSCDVSDEQD